MADVGTWTAGKSFIFVVEKQLLSDPSKKWVNSYEAISIASGGLADLITLGHAIRDFEMQLHPNTVNFVKWLVRTGAHDSQPYNPSTFYEEAIGQVGSNGRTMSNPLDLSVSLWLNRVVVAGRSGKVFFRGVLQETDIEAPAGKITLTAAAKTSWGTDVNIAESGTIRAYFSNGTNTVLRLIMIGPAGQYPRPLLDIDVNGVVIAKKIRSFFNRTGVSPATPYASTLDLSYLADQEAIATAAGWPAGIESVLP